MANRNGIPAPPRDLQAVNDAIRVLTGDATPDAAWRTGQALGLDDAVALALDAAPRLGVAAEPHHPYRGVSKLARRRQYRHSAQSALDGSMHYMHEQLVNERISKLRNEVAVERPVRQARRAGRPPLVGRISSRISHLIRRPTLVRTSPAPTLDTTTSST